MIISASRRTDLPAFHMPWLLERLRAGTCETANPFRPSQISRVSLRPEDVDALVLWTRDARPLLPHLAELDARGYRYYVQYTLTGYPRALEPRVPETAAAVETIRRLADHVGPARVIWRYDPIVFSALTPPAGHLDRFAALAEALHGATRRVVISLLDTYRFLTTRLAGIGLQEVPPEGDAFAGLMRGLAECAAAHGLEIVSCAEPVDLRPFGIAPGHCIDAALIRRLFGRDVSAKKDPSQRPACGCAVSKDIGTYDTCRHGCVYCYATRKPTTAQP